MDRHQQGPGNVGPGYGPSSSSLKFECPPRDRKMWPWAIARPEVATETPRCTGGWKPARLGVGLLSRACVTAGNLQPAFQSSRTVSHSHEQHVSTPVAPNLRRHLVRSTFFLHVSRSSTHVMVSHCGSNTTLMMKPNKTVGKIIGRYKYSVKLTCVLILSEVDL